MAVITFEVHPSTIEESLTVLLAAAKGVAAAADIDCKAQEALKHKPDDPTIQELASGAHDLLHDAVTAIDAVLTPIRDRAAQPSRGRGSP